MKKIGALFAIAFLILPSFASAQQAMSSATYGIESDSLNSGGLRSASANYGLEDSAGEVSTGRSKSSSFALFEAGYQGMRTGIAAPTQVPPSIPTGVAASAVSSSAIDLTWTASTDDYGVTGYSIYRDGTKIASVAEFPREYLDTGLSASTEYTYNISAFDEDNNESASSTAAIATTLAAPLSSAAPSGHSLLSNFAITPDSNSSLVSFTTQTPVVGSVSWGLDAAHNDGTVSDAGPLLNHTLLITNLVPGTRYFLTLTLTDASGALRFQNISFVTLKASNTLPPPNVTHFVAKGGERVINLSWTNPADPTMLGVKIVRSEKFYPNDPTDGTVVFSGRASRITDADVEAGKTYYYAAYSTDQAGNYSSGSVASAKLVAAGEVPVVVPPITQLPQASHVNPIINALALKDFLFIQNGDSVPVTDTLTLDGSRNTTVALKYYRVPEVLKTIAVTLSTTGNNPEYFTFILKANRDKTRYEATIGPLGETRDYNVRITILDFANQSLKSIDGTAHITASPVPSFVPAPAANPLAARTTSFALLIILGLILVLFFGLRGKLLRPAAAAAGALIVLLMIPQAFALADINPHINYQGRLVDGSNAAVTNGSYNMRFNLYTDPSGGTSIWTETHTGSDRIPVTSGLFSVMLGSINDFTGVDFNQPLYLGVEIGGTLGIPTWDGEMTPRKEIGAVPAAFVADTLDGLDSTQFVRSDADTTINANLTVNGTLAVTTGTGNWTGTFGGLTSSFYLANSFSTTSANFWKSANNFFSTTSADAYLATKTSDNITEGSTNKYFTQNNFDAALEATTTLNNLAVLKGVTDLIAARSTTTSATSTNLFATNFVATTASTTSFFGAGLTSCNTAGTNALTWNNGAFGCNTITGSGGSSFGQAFEINSSGYLAPTTTITALFTGGFISQASSTLVGNFNITGNSTTTNATTSAFAISSIASKILKTNANGSIVAAVAGTDYVANTSGDWTGTFDGQEGIYYLANSFSTTSANYWKIVNNFFSTTSADFWKSSNNFFSTTSADAYLATKTSDNLTEGVSNQYFTQGHFDAALEATTTLNNLAILKGISDLIGTRATITNATTTNIFATTASSSNLYFATGNGGSLTLTNTLTAPNILASGSSTLQNFTFVNATGSAATTTNFFSSIGSYTNLFATNGSIDALTASTFTGAGLSNCGNATNALIWSNGLFGCNTITASGGSGADVNWSYFNGSGIRVATTTNQVVIGASSTTTLSKLEVTGGILFDRATGTNATTSSLAISSIISKLLKTNANGSVVAAVANTDYQSPVALTTTGTSGVATFNGTTLNIPNYGAGSYSSTTLLGDNNTFTGTNTFSNPITGSITGNAGTATALQNARTINNVSFNGTANITITAASSTLLADINSFSALNTFANLLATGSSTLQNFTFVNATGSSATTTNFFAATASSTNLFSTNGNIGALTAVTVTSGLINGQTISSAANLTGTLNVTSGLTTLANLLVNGSSTLQTFTFINATGTNATTTNFFATTASTSNLFAAKFAGAGLTDCTSASSALTWNSSTALFGCNSITGTGGVSDEKFATSTGSFLSITPNGGTTVGLGLGTTTPAWTLQVASSTRPQFALSDGSLTSNHWTLRNAGGNLYFATASPSTFATSTFSALTIDTNGALALRSNLTLLGSLGIGTVTPNWSLQVASATPYIAITDTDAATNAKHGLIGFNDGVFTFGTSSDSLNSTSTALSLDPVGSAVFALGTTSPFGKLAVNPIAGDTNQLVVGSSTATSFLIDPAGNVGIGTPSPIATLHVAGSALITSSTTLQNFTFVNATGTSATTTNFFATTASTSKLFIATGVCAGSSALNVNSSGQLVCGTVSGTGGGGASTDKFATSTNGLAIYPNAAAAVVIGATATTTTGAALEVQGQLYVSSSSTLQNLTFVNATGTSATTTSFFATTASSTQLFAAQAKIGSNALVVNTAGNVAIGQAAASFKLDVAGDINFGGSKSLYTGGVAVLTASSTNSSTMLGLLAGANVTFDGSFNTLLGYQAGSVNGNADNNTAVGYASLANSTASNNTAVGSQAGNSNTTGGSNSFFGFNAGELNTTGSQNVLVGYQAGFNNGSATSTVALGYSAGAGATNYNAQNFTAVGTQALANIITGANDNTALGYQAGLNVSSGSKNILLGFQAGTNLTTGSQNILLGYNINAFSASAANTLNIGNAIFGTGLSGTGATLSTNAMIGIGTSTPNWLFQVASATPYIAITDTDAATNAKHGLIGFNSGVFTFGTSSDSLNSTSSSLSLDPGAAAQFGLGTTTPWKTLAVTGTVGLDGLTGSTGAGSLCLSANKEVVYNSASDSCLSSLRSTKHDITPLSMNALDMLNQLVPVSFVYNTGATTTRYGFIADDASAIDKHFGTYDADGNLSGIDDRALVSVMIKGLQELEQKIASSTAPTSLDQVTGAIGLNLSDISAGLDISRDVTIRGGLKVDHLASIGDLLMLQSDVEFVGRPYFNSDTGGLAVVEAGKSQVDIVFDRAYLDAPVVSATISLDASTTDSDLGTVLASNPTYVVGHRGTNGFSIILSKPAEKTTTFSWIALAIKDMKISSSASTTQPIWSFSNDTTINSSGSGTTNTGTTTDTGNASSTDATSTSTPAQSGAGASSTPEIVNTDTGSSTPIAVDGTASSTSSS